MVGTTGRNFPERVYALCQPGGAPAPLFAPGQVVTAETVERFYATDEDVARTAAALTEVGFEVLHTSRLLVNVAGPPELFERVFGRRLHTQEREVVKPGSVRDTGTFIDSEGSPVPGLLETTGSPLADVVAAVAIEEPYYPASVPPGPAPTADPPPVDYWHLTLPDQLAAALRADAPHRDGVTGQGVRVAMVDTGFQAHPFFTSRGYRVEPTVLGPGTADPEVDENGHGTGEAANVFAAAPDATLLPVKAATASGALVNVTAAFTAAVALDPDIVTNSWGSSQPGPPLSAANQALAAAVAAAVADGVVVVFSAGNGSWGFPGQHPDVISAGGVYQGPDGSLRASDYASGFVSRVYPGRRVPDVSGLVGLLPAAMYLMLPVPPGCTIDRGNAGGTHPEGDETAPDDGWAAFSGTSAAAPQLAGVCALLAQAAPGTTPGRVREVLAATARDVTTGTNHPEFGEPAGTGPDLATGPGLVDAAAAVAALGAGAEGDTAVALVMLRSPSGQEPTSFNAATSSEWLPAAGTVREVAGALGQAGFTVGPASGPTLSIAAPPAVFARVFAAEPVRADDGGWTSAQGDSLPLDALPEKLREVVRAVVLERPAELHTDP
ncbi:Subtilase family protein [Georgenia satyanarayanai]|uniref:Subtilase family protein n=1 Tax=Georgenia satyanarayanai TaxID=860221 RepID=A0A2Y9APL4_9MICO|nr:S8 family serine peptidase [Georgenia satyanarayanai]PYF97234.1 subtilase family protein [Georgenia satyanarayanai]SSA46320.1 Subtilase family protein [Georgenia satyanarayanai]